MPNDLDDEKRNPNAPGGYEGFDAYFNANKATSQASAGRYANQARQSVTAASNALQKTQNDFNQQLSNAPAANVGVAAGIRPTSTSAAPGAVGTSTNVGGGSPGAQVPGSLGDVASFQSAADKANKAQQTLNGLGLAGMGGLDANGVPRGDLTTLVAGNNPGASSGANRLSANLIGSAGRGQFDALEAQFNPVNDFNRAVVKSAMDSKAATDAAQAQRDAITQRDATANAAAGTINSGSPAGALSNTAPPAIPDNITTVDQAIASGFSPDQIVKKFGYAAYSDSVGAASQRGQR